MSPPSLKQRNVIVAYKIFSQEWMEGQKLQIQRACEVHCYATPIYNLGKVPSHKQIFPRFCYLKFMKFTFLGFHVLVLEDISIDVLILNVGLILTKLRWFHSSSQVKIQFRTYLKKKKKKKKNGFPWCSTCEDLSIDVSITNVGLILTKPGWFLFSGYGQTDRVLESSHGNMSAHKKFQLKDQN